jgi:type VI secretion system VasD/TssJ family lipoprotein
MARRLAGFWWNWSSLLGALALAGSVSSCGGSPPPAPAAPPKPCEPVPPTLSITATQRANASSAGEGRPVQLRIYQLKGDARLRTASFEDIWQNDAKTLEGELVSVEQQTVFPGETKEFTIAPKPDAHYLALVALFREPQGKDWFLSYELAPTAKEPPCPTKPQAIPIWIDRMQIQDGTGRAPEGSESSPPATGGS